MAATDLPLRARKRAQTRIALVEALIERLSDRPLEEIQVRELVGQVGVSEGTFFNYFPNKPALLTHFIQLWSLRMAALARRVRAANVSALGAIEALFIATAEETREHPKVMLETIAHQARMPANLETEPVELAERLLYLPGEPDVESLPDHGLGGILPELVGEAVAAGELPSSTDVMQLTAAVASVFFGTPVVLGLRNPEQLAALYREQLGLIWAGARAGSQEAT